MLAKKTLAKIISFGLILFSFYQIWLSLQAIFFIYPKLQFHQTNSLILEEGLVEKALLIYASMITSGLYGMLLFFKPSEKIKLIHIFTGIVIFIASLFFVVETPFTTGPIRRLINQWLKIKP